ncbi:MAG: HlyD family efflux transporter periplasmic adaptor subunit [Firmicutes bacterium]|nr:HlyD family efflux transporter periplasmic adaptor subunit [Bacillota bacterium]
MEKKKPVAAVLLVLLLGLGAYLSYQYYISRGNGNITATGTIEATRVELSTKSSGTIRTMTVKAGDIVAPGQLVAELQRNDLVAQRERDAIALAKAEDQLADLESGAREPEINQARANVSIARTNLEKTRSDLEKRETLLAQGAVSQDEVDRYRANLQLNEGQLQAAQAQLDLLESGNRPKAIAAARNEVERSRAVLKASDAMLEDLKVIAPRAGTIQTKNYEVGEYVQAGASLASLVDLNDQWIKVYIPTDQLPGVRLGQDVSFTVSGMSETFYGVVVEISDKGEYTPKTIQTKEERANVVFGVKIRINSGGGVLKPGMPADVTFERGPEK